MTKLWKPIGEETLRHWINSILDEASDKLTDWELNFIESIEKRLDLIGSLSQKQEEILERIYSERTSL